MKNVPLLLLLLLALAMLPACNQTVTPPAGSAAGEFLKNTEWVGIFRPLSRQYDKPCCLRFNSDTSLTLYGLFYFRIDGTFVQQDSVAGKITRIEDTDAGISVRVDFPSIGDNPTLLVTDRKKLTCIGAFDASQPNSFSLGLELFPAGGIGVKGTAWNGPLIQGGRWMVSLLILM